MSSIFLTTAIILGILGDLGLLALLAWSLVEWYKAHEDCEAAEASLRRVNDEIHQFRSQGFILREHSRTKTTL